MVLDETDQEKWNRIKKLYDDVDRSRRSRASRSSETKDKLSPEATREFNKNAPTNISFQLNVMEELTFYYEGTTRLNFDCSEEHIANIVLRCHEQKFEWKRIPFKPKCYIYNVVWRTMCLKVRRLKEQISDEWELFERFDGLTGSYERSSEVRTKKRMYGLTYEIINLED
jgi:hypothetical protein